MLMHTLLAFQEKFETGSSSRDPPLPSMGSLPSQSQFDDSYVSSGPTETQKSLEEGGEGDFTVAIPGMASSQVDDKAVEEGSSAETVPDPFANRDRTTVETQAAPSTIMITIRLADGIGTTLELPFRSNQTISDIRNAIDQRYPDNDRGYNLQSMDGVDYMDWNVTVYRVTRHDSRTLMQIYP
ncbi:BnaA05g10610D [Brassica napus]|uniref:BnaA05g10610D protein n=1 Tax=Brassica napus TaxID=3708 RepID=A0A078FWM3_BRANA|nr:BnaA05g10610D [Brassica napus]